VCKEQLQWHGDSLRYYFSSDWMARLPADNPSAVATIRSRAPTRGRAHDQQGKAVEGLSIRRLNDSMVAACHCRRQAISPAPRDAEMHQVVRERTELPVLVLDSHRDEGQVVAVRPDELAVRDQLDARRRAAVRNSSRAISLPPL